MFAIERGSLEQRLQALAVLLRVRSPSTVRLQWQVLNELQQRTDRPNWQPLLAEFRECFSERHLAEELQKDPPSDEYASEPSSYYWSIRAAGVVQYEAAIDRLVELSKSDNLDTCIAAERSLEDFTGHRADEALAQCVQGWRYSAYKWAAGALFKRNPRLLEHVLLNANPPEDCRYQVGLFLARLDRPEAVPILCETVPRYQQIDREMFAQIARLGRLEDREIIAALPAHVRPKQRQAAEDAVREFELRIGRIDP